MDSQTAIPIRSHGVTDLNDRIRRRRNRGNRPGRLPAEAVLRHPSAAGPSADHRQAMYFAAVLVQESREIDRRIDKCRKAIAVSEASGQIDDVRSFRRLLRSEERRHQAVEDLLGNLRRRFPASPTGVTG